MGLDPNIVTFGTVVILILLFFSFGAWANKEEEKSEEGKEITGVPKSLKEEKDEDIKPSK